MTEQIDRRRFLAGLVGAAAATAGFAALPQSAASVGLARGRVNVQDFGAIGDGVADDTVAVNAAFDAARGRARQPHPGAPLEGLPTVYFPAGTYRLSRTLHRAGESGLTIEGDGIRASVLQVQVRAPLLEVTRSSGLLVRGLTLSCGAPDVPWRTGLVENSTAVLFNQRSGAGGTVAAGSTKDATFERCEFVGFHRALWFLGTEGGDGVTWRECRWVDNFIDFEFANGRSTGGQVLGGEVSSFQGAPASHYNERLARWSAGSRPSTARAEQPRVPSDPAGPRQPITVRDGAVCRALAGGGMLLRGTSIAAAKTTLLFGELPSDARLAVATFGTAAIDATWAFESCYWRGLGSDAQRDLFGYERSTLLRYEQPHPGRNVRSLRATVRVVAPRFDPAPPPALLHLTNGVRVDLLDAATALADPRLRVVSCVTGAGSTVGDPGLLAVGGSATPRLVVDARLPGGRRRWANPLGVGHRVTQPALR